MSGNQTMPAWRPLCLGDQDQVQALAAACRRADGGAPFAAEPSFLAARFDAGPGLVAVVDSAPTAQLVAAVALRQLDSPSPGGPSSAATGLIHPDWRGRGLGSHAVDWALATGTAPVQLETESLTAPAEALFHSRGLGQAFAADVMAIDLGRLDREQAEHPSRPRRADLRLREWTPGLIADFFAVYQAAFAERPGFPGWSAQQWTEWVSDDPDFAPQWTLLASPPDTQPDAQPDAQPAIGFIACASGPGRTTSWIIQVGVVPAARRTGLGAALVLEALDRMRAAGVRTAWLDVNVNNPGARRGYERLGFTPAGRRARFQ